MVVKFRLSDLADQPFNSLSKHEMKNWLRSTVPASILFSCKNEKWFDHEYVEI